MKVCQGTATKNAHARDSTKKGAKTKMGENKQTTVRLASLGLSDILCPYNAEEDSTGYYSKSGTTVSLKGVLEQCFC